MGSWDVYCALCGGPLQDQLRTKHGPDDPDEKAQDPGTLGMYIVSYMYDGSRISLAEMQWLNQVRALAPLSKDWNYPDSTDARDGYWISGIGYPSYYGEIIVPYSADFVLHAWMGDGDTQVSKRLVCYLWDEQPIEKTVFPFHKACLDIFQRALERKMEDTGIVEPISRNIIHAVLVKHSKSRALDFDYGHLLHGSRWGVRRGDERFVSDPLSVKPLQDLLSNLPRRGRNASIKDSAPCLLTSKRPQDTFKRLPLELLYRIITLLPARSVKSLRLASRSFATVHFRSYQKFWLSRIIHDIPYVWEVAPSELERDGNGEDWRNIYFKLIRESDGWALGLANRKRIWGNCGFLVDEVLGLVVEGDSDIPTTAVCTSSPNVEV